MQSVRTIWGFICKPRPGVALNWARARNRTESWILPTVIVRVIHGCTRNLSSGHELVYSVRASLLSPVRTTRSSFVSCQDVMSPILFRASISSGTESKNPLLRQPCMLCTRGCVFASLRTRHARRTYDLCFRRCVKMRPSCGYTTPHRPVCLECLVYFSHCGLTVCNVCL